MAKPVMVPEDEALKFYRIKNLTMPPEAFELSELDKEMGNVLSRTDLPSRQKAVLYYKALTKFRDLYKDLFNIPVEDVNKSDVERKIKEVEQAASSSPDLNLNQLFQTPPGSPTAAGPQQQSAQSLLDNDEDEMDSSIQFETQTPPNLTTNAQFLQNAIEHAADRKKFYFSTEGGKIEISSKHYKKSMVEPVWNKVLNFLASPVSSSEPKWGAAQRGKPALIRNLARFILQNKIITKEEVEKYPNFANILDIENLRKSNPPSSFKIARKYAFASPILNKPTKKTGAGVKVNFKSWNEHLKE